jgi:hypothetical protein
MLAREYGQPFGESDAEIRSRLGVRGKVADFVGYNREQDRWLIAESRGSDLDFAYLQLLETAERLQVVVPTSACRVSLRLYLSPLQRVRLARDGLGGWRLRDGLLGWLGESNDWHDAEIAGSRVVVLPAQEDPA